MNYEFTDFEKQVLERSRQVPVMVDFWAPWCGPCRTLGPILERMAAAAQGRWELVKVNVEEHPELAAEYRVSSIPAVKLFAGGRTVSEFVGARRESEIARFLDASLPSPNAARVQEAERLLEDGASARAAAELEEVLAEEPGNLPARILLGRTLLSSAPERITDVLAPIGEDSDVAEKAKALRSLARVAQLSADSALPEGKVRELYLSGSEALRRGDLSGALAAFISVLERDKEYDQRGAREACRAIFQLLGTQHEISQRHHRAFSSALHS